MSVWYAFLNALGIRMFEMDFMKNALLAVLLLGPLFGLLSTMIVTGKMSFFSDALGHSGFTGIAIGIICGVAAPIWAAVLLRPQPDEPVGGHHHRRLFLHGCRAGHFYRHARRAELYKIQPLSHRRYPVCLPAGDRAAGAGSAGGRAAVDIRGESSGADGGPPAAGLLARHCDKAQ